MSKNQNYSSLTGIAVEVGNNFNSALRKFKRKVDNSGILIDYVKRQRYEKPSERRKREKATARARWLKKQKTLKSLS